MINELPLETFARENGTHWTLSHSPLIGGYEAAMFLPKGASHPAEQRSGDVAWVDVRSRNLSGVLANLAAELHRVVLP